MTGANVENGCIFYKITIVLRSQFCPTEEYQWYYQVEIRIKPLMCENLLDVFTYSIEYDVFAVYQKKLTQ